MPKIIPDVRNKILNSARKQLIESGFNGLSLRGVATDCGIAVGTTYNYFSSKTELANVVMENEWKEMIANTGTKKGEVSTAAEGVTAIYHAIHTFVSRYSTVIDQESNSSASLRTGRFNQPKLTSQIKDVLNETLESFGYHETESCLILEAELILAASISENAQEADFADLTRRVFEGTKVRTQE